MYKTANLRKPDAEATRVTVRAVQAANDNAGADYLAEDLRTKFQDPAFAELAEEAMKAYVFGVAKSRRLKAGEARPSDAAEAIRFYVALRDNRLDLTRAQQHWLFFWAYTGIGMHSHAERAEKIYRNPFFED